jgi:predicted lipid-binding transport protein (Tim44 family)
VYIEVTNPYAGPNDWAVKDCPMSNSIIQLLVLAGIAIFLILKLRNVLGTRDGFEAPSQPQPPEIKARRGFEVIEGGPDRDITDHVTEGSDAAKALAAMKLVEPSFSVSGFLQGARGAYEMILTSFAKGEMEKIRPFLSPDVAESFSAVLADRKAQGLTVSTEFVGLRELTLHGAEFDRASGEGEVTIRFVAELISATRDIGGEIVEGDAKVARKQKDVWTFARKMGADDPNWQLVATGE